MRWRWWGIAPAALAAAPGCGADVARAGQASAEAGTVRFADAAGASDRLSATIDLVDGSSPDPAGWNVVFYAVGEPQATPGAGCVAGFVGVLCALGATAPAALTVDLGAGDDALELGLKLNAKAAPTQIAIAGGPGNDEIETIGARAEIDGGEGDDVIAPDERYANDLPPDRRPAACCAAARGRTAATTRRRSTRSRSRSTTGRTTAVRARATTCTRTSRTYREAPPAATGRERRGEPDHWRAAADRIAAAPAATRSEGRGGDDTVDALDTAAGDRVTCGDGDDVA